MSIKEIKILEEEIVKNKNLYYSGKPIISDFEYDALEAKLKKIDPQNSILAIVGSLLFSGPKVAHEKKMLSLNKTYKADELIKWMGSEELIGTYKIDGSSCSLIYDSGKLQMAKTRGDGRHGENITNKALFLSEIPKALSNTGKLEVRGEIYCRAEKFHELSKVMESLGLEKPSNQRNIVAGILGRKENIELSKYLSFQAFELISNIEQMETEKQKFEMLNENGFITPDTHFITSKDQIDTFLLQAQEFMSEGDYLIDGLVFTLNKLSLHDELGETAHHPRYKMAFKFQGDTKTTKINSISWQVSRNGFLTPVANVEPVELSGAMVGRVTLHNFGMVEQFKLKQGDEIEIVRSGEVIPKFLSVVTSADEEFSFPEKCPSCGEKVYKEEIRLICRNVECPDKVKDDILNFIKKIGIDDLSSKRLEEMIRRGFVKDISSLYELTSEQLLSMDKVKEKLTTKILESIEKSKNSNLVNFLAALGLSGGAYNKCEKLVSYGHDTIEKVMALKISDIEAIESFAEKSATEMVNSLKSKKNLIEKLVSYGFEPKHVIASVSESEITGLKFCITGTLTFKRSELQKMVKENGGIVQASVNKDTNYLITNDIDSSSSKFKKAKSLNLPIITEDEFFKLIGK